MNRCTGTDKPLIAILMAVYEPRMDWLRIQLQSLNAQTYPKLRLYIRDDCSRSVPFEQIQSCVQDCISAFPYEMRQNEQNLGSNGTFEQLTREAEGSLFAYCDQDDEWLADKLTTLQAAMEKERALLACSDMYVIDAEGRVTADSITRVRRHHVFHSGTGLAGGLMFRNFVTGCTMLVDAREAKAAAPFCPYLVHDQYIALCCAQRGSIVSVMQPLIRYRIHGENQTGTLAGITDRTSYERIRIDGSIARLEWLREHIIVADEADRQEFADGFAWVYARQKHWHRQGGFATVLKYLRFGPLTVLFESVAPYLPDGVFQCIIALRKRTAM